MGVLQNSTVHADIAVSNIGRARQWYQEKLDLVPMKEMMTGELVYQLGEGSTMLVYQSEFAGTAKNTVAGWLVDDLESAMSELRSRGVTFEEYDLPGIKTVNGVATFGEDKTAWFKDSEGNIFEMSQMTGR